MSATNQTSGSLGPPWIASPKDPIEGSIDLPALLIVAAIATLIFIAALIFVCFFIWKKTNPIYENKAEDSASPTEKSPVWRQTRHILKMSSLFFGFRNYSEIKFFSMTCFSNNTCKLVSRQFLSWGMNRKYKLSKWN